MNQDTVHILGEDITISFCMAVEIAYEEISGEAFDVATIDNRKKMLILDYAAILTAKPDTTISFDRLVKEAKPKEISALSEAVCNAMYQWYEIPAVMAEPKVEKKDEEAPKN